MGKSNLIGDKRFLFRKAGKNFKMTIGIDAHNLEGRRTGVGRVLINLLKEWSKFDLPEDLPRNKAGLKFILYFKKEIPDDLNLSDSIFSKKILQAPFSWQSNALFTHYLLPKADKKDKIDILFCPGYIAPVAYKRKIALSLHDIIYEARPEPYNWPSFLDRILLRKVSKISAKKAQIIFTCSQFSKNEILKYYQVSPEKVFTIPLAADECFKQINNQEQIDQIKEKYQIKDKFIFFIGSIFNRRHLKEVILAFEKTANQLPNYQFLIIGANHTSPFIDIDGLIEEVNQNLNRQAILRKDYSSNEDLPLLYNAADLLVWLSNYEGFGLPILEAMACAAPVITSPTTSIPEVAGDSVMFVKDPENIDEIARAIYRGLTDQSLRQDLIEKGLKQAQRFSWPRCAEQTLKALLDF